ncbi:hypothetical protein FTV88_0520 [Heliorestis convoluta]|uniref:Uncharacterized protein n=1 Tax=Heliorestis convoluta TaxID=356322 RepID=A0A5Q2MZ43_9FIRM|nr:hypothetical protein FTV88_0520 [Heliorestis convoluta]
MLYPDQRQGTNCIEVYDLAKDGTMANKELLLGSKALFSPILQDFQPIK